MTKPKLLIVEDDESIQTQLKYALRDDYVLAFAGSREQTLAAIRESVPDVVTLDLGLPPHPDTAEEGLRTLGEILGVLPTARVIVLTGNSERESALRAVETGAFDFQMKPIDLASLKVVLQRGAYLSGLAAEADHRAEATEQGTRFEEIVGTTEVMRHVFAMAKRVAKTDATVLVEGESGTGKELLARAIHARSPRHDKPFVAINCGAIPETLLEAELFGHEKGSFTGAHVQRRGKVELADGGTLFLDEIAELSPLLQVKLLRVLQEHTIERIGGRETIHLDIRVVAATNKDLKAQRATGQFREDLYYRLAVVTIQIPPLRDRGEDLILLANTFLRRAGQEYRRKTRFTVDASSAILAYPWPGNVRELENRIQRAVIMTEGKAIAATDLGLETPAPDGDATLRDARHRTEHQTLVEALAKHRGNISRAAKELEVSRPTLHGLLTKHRIDASAFRSRSAARDS
jgi:two-component system NtrC family response regulator